LLQKKRKISALLYGLCSEFEESMAKFVQGIGNLEQRTAAGSTTRANVVPKEKPQRPRKRQRTSHEEEAALQDDTDDSVNSDDDEADNLVLNDDDDTDDDRRQVISKTQMQNIKQYNMQLHDHLEAILITITGN
jgi:hypothetical protein